MHMKFKWPKNHNVSGKNWKPTDSLKLHVCIMQVNKAIHFSKIYCKPEKQK